MAKAFAPLGRSQGSRPIPPPSPEALALKGHDHGKGGKDDEREENGTQAENDLADSWNCESDKQDADDQCQPQHGVLWGSVWAISYPLNRHSAGSSLVAHVRHSLSNDDAREELRRRARIRAARAQLSRARKFFVARWTQPFHRWGRVFSTGLARRGAGSPQKEGSRTKDTPFVQRPTISTQRGGGAVAGTAPVGNPAAGAMLRCSGGAG